MTARLRFLPLVLAVLLLGLLPVSLARQALAAEAEDIPNQLRREVGIRCVVAPPDSVEDVVKRMSSSQQPTHVVKTIPGQSRTKTLFLTPTAIRRDHRALFFVYDTLIAYDEARGACKHLFKDEDNTKYYDIISRLEKELNLSTGEIDHIRRLNRDYYRAGLAPPYRYNDWNKCDCPAVQKSIDYIRSFQDAYTFESLLQYVQDEVEKDRDAGDNAAAAQAGGN